MRTGSWEREALDLANEASKAPQASLEEKRHHGWTMFPFAFLSQLKHTATTRSLDHNDRSLVNHFIPWLES